MACPGNLAAVLLTTVAGLQAGAATPANEPPYLAYSATARDLKSLDFLYREEHFVRLDAGRTAERVVLYTCSDGRPFARKRLLYGSDALAPEFQMENALSGHQEALRRTASGATISYRENFTSRQRTGPMPAQPGIVADAGFDEFVRRNWASLVAGNRLRFDFLVPSRLDYYSFKVRKLRADTVMGTPVQVFRLTLSGLWGYLLPGIDVFYRDSDQALLRYEGISNLQNAAGENFRTIIEFPENSRHPLSGEGALRTALKQPLVSSCRSPSTLG